MLMATNRHATNASRTASGVAPPAYVTAKMMENATAAAGAMWVIDWNRTGARPTASRCSLVAAPDVLTCSPSPDKGRRTAADRSEITPPGPAVK